MTRTKQIARKPTGGLPPSTSRAQDSGITVFAVVEVSESNHYHSSEETRDVTRTLYSTLKSANRAAIRSAREAMDNDDYGGLDEEEDLGFVGHWDHRKAFRAEKQFTKFESWSVKVERQTLKVYGPNLALGEVDSDSSEGEGDSDDDEDDDEQEEEHENPEKAHADTSSTRESTARQKRSPSVLVISDSEQEADSRNKKQKV